MKRATLAALIGTTALGLGVSLAAPEAKAICLPTDPGPCGVFNPSTNSRVIQALSPVGLSFVQYLQAGASASKAGQNISNIAYSTTDPAGNFNSASFVPLDANLSTYLGPSVNPGTIVNTGSALGVNTVWLRYQIDAPNAFVPGDLVQVSLFGNTNGFDQLGFLSNNGSNRYFANTIQNDVQRQSTVPGPLPLLGAGAAFGFSRQMRRRLKASA